MTATQVRDALDGRWPAAEYVSIDEAAQSPDRQGRKLDRLVVSLWRSRGLELDGVEIKVSLSDWRRELANAEKADWWWEHVHRFWIVVPDDITAKVRDDLPTGWGLLACTEGGTKVVVKPEKHEAKALPWAACVGLLRTASGAGLNALQRARQQGVDAGRQQAKSEFERTTGDEALRRQLDSLRAKVEAFEAASGLRLVDAFGDREAGELGRIVALVREAKHNPLSIPRDIGHTADRMERMAGELRAIGSVLAEQGLAHPAATA